MHVYVREANFTTKPRFEAQKLPSFAYMNSQGKKVEKNIFAQKVQMHRVLLRNKICLSDVIMHKGHYSHVYFAAQI